MSKVDYQVVQYILQFGCLLTSFQAYALLVVSFIYLQGIFENQKSIEIYIINI